MSWQGGEGVEPSPREFDVTAAFRDGADPKGSYWSDPPTATGWKAVRLKVARRMLAVRRFELRYYEFDKLRRHRVYEATGSETERHIDCEFKSVEVLLDARCICWGWVCVFR